MIQQDSVNLLAETPCPGGFTHLRLYAPQIAQRAEPGQSIQWGQQMLAIMRADGPLGWVELLLAGDMPSSNVISGPLGKPIVLAGESTRWLLIGNISELASLIFCADQLRKRKGQRILMMLQADGELPFRPVPCRTLLPGVPAGVIATLPLLNDWGVIVRIASHSGLPGCYDGEVESLAEMWLATQSESVTEVRC